MDFGCENLICLYNLYVLMNKFETKENVMSEKLLVLAQEVVDLKNQYMAKLQELNAFLAGETVEEVVPAKKKETNTKSMNDIVLEYLSKHENATLKDIVTHVDKLIREGKYHTTSTNISSLVSQALNKLKNKDLIKADKNPESNRSVYSKAA